MTSGDVRLPAQDLPHPDFFERMVAQRERVVQTIQQAGGIDFEALLAQPPEAAGGRQHFKRIPDICFDGIPLAFKQSVHNAWLLCDDFAEEIATLNHIATQRPDLEEMLPRVHYELRQEDEPVGILTEDFTRNGELVQWNETSLFGFQAMFTDPSVVDWDHACEMVGQFGQREKEYSPSTPSILRVIDVSPLYSFPGTDRYPAWFTAEVGLDRILPRVEDLRIKLEEISSSPG